MALPTQVQQALTWQAYSADAKNLVSPQVCDFTTYSAYTFNPQGLFRQTGSVYATGLVIDNLLSVSPVTVVIGALTETVPPYTKTTLQLSGTSAQVVVSGTQSRIIVTFYFGTYLGTTSGTNFYAAQLAAGLAVETGFINMFAGSTASIPVGYLLCDGTAVSRTDYAGLFSKIGELYGKGDGTTTFNLPNLSSRVPIGAGTGTGLSTRGLGSTGGAEQVILSGQQIPAHTHFLDDPGHVHAMNDPGHLHAVNDPQHAHVLDDPGHLHAVNDPGHGHYTTDPGHYHGYASFQPNNGAKIRDDAFMYIQDVNASRFGYNNTADPSNSFFIGHPTNRDTAAAPYYYRYQMNPANTGLSINVAASNVTLQGAVTKVTARGASTGISLQGAYTGVSVQGATTGVTARAYGGLNGVTQPTPTVPPYAAVNFVIKT